MQTDFSKHELMNYALFVIRKRKVLVLSIGLATFLSIIVFTFLITPTWEGTTKVLIERSSKQSLSVFKDVNLPVGGNIGLNSDALDLLSLLTGENMAYDVVKEFSLDERLRNKRFHPTTLRERIKNLIVDILLSPKTALQKIGLLEKVEKNWLDEAAEDFLEDWEDIEEEEGTSVISITVYGETPRLAMDIANRMVELLRERTQSFTREGARASYDFVQNQMIAAEENLKSAEEALGKFKEENAIVNMEQEKGLKTAKLNEFESELLATSKQRKELEARLFEINTELERQQEKIILSTIIAKNPVVTELEQNLVNLEIKLASLFIEKKEEHPDAQILRAGIQKSKDKLKSAMENIVQSQTESINPIFQDLLDRAIILRTESFALEAREQALQKIIDDLKAVLKELPTKELELARLQTILDINRSVYDTLKTRLGRLAIEQESMISEYNIRVLDRAYVSDSVDYDWPIWPLNIIAGLFLAIVFGFGSAFLAEYWNDAIINHQDLERDISLPFLGDIPDLKDLSS